VTLHELFSLIAAAIWALLWWPVGRSFGWLAGAGAFVIGGFAGLVVGYFLMEWINRLQPHRTWIRTGTAFAVLVIGMIAYVGIPLWVLSLLRSE
jgi:O-antigen/teichoic acid export membrane protein